jgi:hypothetical protein
MASRQKNVRLPERGWELLAELARGYGSEAETIVAALEALKARNDSARSPHPSPGALVRKPIDNFALPVRVVAPVHDLTVEPIYD